MFDPDSFRAVAELSQHPLWRRPLSGHNLTAADHRLIFATIRSLHRLVRTYYTTTRVRTDAPIEAITAEAYRTRLVKVSVLRPQALRL